MASINRHLYSDRSISTSSSSVYTSPTTVHPKGIHGHEVEKSMDMLSTIVLRTEFDVSGIHSEIGMFSDTHNNYSDGYSGKRTGNEPHPMLEYPMLYNNLPKGLLKSLGPFYSLRWKLSYPLQHRLPLHFGSVTYGEALLFVPFFVGFVAVLIYTAAAFPTSVAVTGRIARLGLIAALVFAQRNSFFTLFLGMPIDRTLFYHKLAGRFAGCSGILHTMAFFLDPRFQEKHQNDPIGGAFTGKVNISGSMIMVFVILIALTAMQRIRRHIFEFFFYLHYLFVAGIIFSALFHSGILVPTLAFLTWGVDLMLRKFFLPHLQNPKRATLRIVSETVVEVSFPKFDHNPGQFVYICVPEISFFQWHPFSISSSPSQGNAVTLHIRKLGDWTSALMELAHKESEIAVCLEGPYGNLAVDLVSNRDKYKSVLLISGGIGVTPMQSIADQLLYEHSQNKRTLDHLKFIWIERDPILVHKAGFVHNTCETCKAACGKKQAPKGMVEQLLSQFPPDQTTDLELERQYNFQGGGRHGPATQDTENPQNSSKRAPSGRKTVPEVVDMQIYLTGDRATGQLSPFVRVGRPDIRGIFIQMREDAEEAGNNKVAVCVSAPLKVSELVFKACILFSDEKVRFDFHSECIEG